MSDLAPWRQIAPWPRAGQADRVVEIAPDAEVRAALAARLDLEGLSRLSARLVLRPWLDGFEIEGDLDASAERICGVSLEPYAEAVTESIAVRLLPPSSPHLPRGDEAEVIVDLDAPDPPEAGEAEGADLAVVVAEALALGLSPFARKPDIAFEPPPEDLPPSPFAILRTLSPPAPDEA